VDHVNNITLTGRTLVYSDDILAEHWAWLVDAEEENEMGPTPPNAIDLLHIHLWFQASDHFNSTTLCTTRHYNWTRLP
jgi:hypothetical protein